MKKVIKVYDKVGTVKEQIHCENAKIKRGTSHSIEWLTHIYEYTTFNTFSPVNSWTCDLWSFILPFLVKKIIQSTLRN